MILVDTGPLVAAFDPRDADHDACVLTLDTLGAKALTTTPVLTEAFRLLRQPGRRTRFMDFVLDGGLRVATLDHPHLRRCFELMVQYGDTPMDFADASVVAVAERSGIDRVFTLDGRHFSVYRMKRGYRHVPFTLVGPRAEPPMVRETGDPDGAYAAEAVPVSSDDGDALDAVHGRLLAETALREAREALDRLGRALGTRDGDGRRG